MIGQKNLIEQFNTFTFETLPTTMLLVGEKGCGKHTLMGMLSAKFSIDFENISDKLTYEKIVDLFLNPLPKFYVIDKDMSISEQNSLLKFIEEPPKTAKVFILCENENSLLETIVGRCQKFYFEEYSEDELLNFTTNKELISYFKTPGQLLSFSNDNMWVFDLCKTILTKIDLASIPNVLTLSNKFNFGKDDTKFDIGVFMKLLVKTCYDFSIKDNKYTYVYLTILNWLNKMKIPNVDKQKIFELCLFDIKQTLKNDNTRVKTTN